MKLQVVTRRSSRANYDMRLWNGKCSIGRHLIDKHLIGKQVEFAVDTEDPHKRFVYIIPCKSKTADSYKATTNMNFKNPDLCKHFESVGKDVKFAFERVGKDDTRDIIILKRLQ